MYKSSSILMLPPLYGWLGHSLSDDLTHAQNGFVLGKHPVCLHMPQSVSNFIRVALGDSVCFYI